MRPDDTITPETAARRFLDSLEKPSRILVAISGGSDSTGLLLAFAEALSAASNSGISLCAATVDHALRAESAEEARQVAALCQSLSIAHTVKIWSGDKPRSGIMAAARHARYGLLAEAAAEMNADIVVTAHTLDDQRETLAMRGERSERETTGISDWVLFERRMWIARPFLGCLREDIRDLLRVRHVSWSDDPSNDDPKYERVRMRQRLTGATAASGATPDAAGRRLALSTGAASWLAEHFRLHPHGLGQVAASGLQPGNPIFEYALARLAAVFGGQPFALGREQMQTVLGVIERGHPGRVTAGRVVFDLRRDGLYLARESRGIVPLRLPPGVCAIWDERFVVENNADVTITIEAGSLIEPPDGLPRAAARRSIAALPRFVDDAGDRLCADSAAKVTLTHYFAPFDRFLTRFDVIFANGLAAAFGTRPYPKPPLGLIDGKTI